MNLVPVTSRACLTAMAGITTVLMVACTRYEYINELKVPGLCPRDEAPIQPGGHLIVGSAAQIGDIVGEVVQRYDRQVVQMAMVSLRGADSASVLTDSTGAFAFRGVSAGQHVIWTRRVGYGMRRDTVVVGSGGGLTLTIPLELLALDGPCSGFMVLAIPKPWWKWW